jgi:murein DD-endopeptidase MepM/ murein hydrolase activator NlpD
MKLAYYPDGDVTQFFGENPALYAQFDLAGHNGTDLVRPWGEDLYAIEDAEVVSTVEDPHGYGKNVRLLAVNKNQNGYYNEWVYGHTSKNLVKVGDMVKAGDKIALMGNTGFTISGSTPYWNVNPYRGTHVHLGLRQAKRLKTSGFTYAGSTTRLSIVNYGNGYKGYIDPAPFLTETASNLYQMFRQLLTIKGFLNTLIK